MQPTVIVNRHRQTAIIVAQAGNKFQIIKLGKGRLKIASLSAAEIEKQGYSVCSYSASQAAHAYLKHGAGVSQRAKQCLEQIACNKFSDVLNLA